MSDEWSFEVHDEHASAPGVAVQLESAIDAIYGDRENADRCFQLHLEIRECDIDD